MSPMMETINMVNINIIIKCQFYMSGLKLVLILICSVLVCSICWQYSPARTRSQAFRSVANRHRTGNKGNFISSVFVTVNCWDEKLKEMSNAILMFFRQGVLVLLFPWLCSVLKIWRPLLVRLLLRAVSEPYYGLSSWNEYTVTNECERTKLVRKVHLLSLNIWLNYSFSRFSPSKL